VNVLIKRLPMRHFWFDLTKCGGSYRVRVVGDLGEFLSPRSESTLVLAAKVGFS
jgi:hypothetical protein